MYPIDLSLDNKTREFCEQIIYRLNPQSGWKKSHGHSARKRFNLKNSMPSTQAAGQNQARLRQGRARQ
jgi:uncharacterized protein YfaP (DUF2135 family)